MNKHLICLLISCSLFLAGCQDQKLDNTLSFAVSADYPPFEYYESGVITGFDIELANLISKELSKEAKFIDMQYSTIMPSLNNGSADAAISTIASTEERQKKFDFSTPYYTASFAVVFPKEMPITDKAQLPGKKIACQLGSTMQTWLEQHIPTAEIILMDNNNQEIEALKAGHVDGVLLDSMQAVIFSQKNPTLAYAAIAQAGAGYAIAFKKGSPLKDQVNAALKVLQENGELQQLKLKWLENDKWQN
jgi:polar amino acid transport system substrate-binding protein